jgi:hypothetical protein
MWAGNGSGIRFPDDSGMAIGGPDSGIQLLVLQVIKETRGAMLCTLSKMLVAPLPI